MSLWIASSTTGKEVDVGRQASNPCCNGHRSESRTVESTVGLGLAVYPMPVSSPSPGDLNADDVKYTLCLHGLQSDIRPKLG